MATILELEARKVLERYDAELGAHQLETRTFFASQRLVRWFNDELPILASNWNIESKPDQQLDSLLGKYVSGDVMCFQWDLFPLTPHEKCVWELKTADLRVFGWFASIDCFVGVVADTAERVKLYKLYAGYIGEVVRYRQSLDLNEPKFVEGKEAADVISNFNYP